MSMAVKEHARLEILVPYPKGLGPSQRFRIEIYEKELERLGIRFRYHAFLDEQGYQVLYQKGQVMTKLFYILKGLWGRIRLLPLLRGCDVVLVQREAAPLGPAVVEWLIKSVLKKKLIYDIDDAIWMPNYAVVNKRWQWLKFYGKVNNLIKWSDKVIAGNEFLKSHAEQWNDEVVLIPTVVDTEHTHLPSDRVKDGILTLGWTGTHSTNRHIEYLRPVFERLSRRLEFRLLLISNERPRIDMPNVEFIPWSQETEIEDLQQIDLGLMPLIPDFAFAEGKCGFKAIQFMALGIPTLASPKGVNSSIIDDQRNGLLCSDLKEWEHRLEQVILNYDAYKDLAQKGRETIEQEYSVKANKEKFIKALFT